MWANWNKDALIRTTIFCNSFENLVSTKLDRILTTEANNIYRIQKFVSENPLQTTEKYFEIFNDTSIHIFKEADLCGLIDSFWNENPEPVYPEEDLELITKEISRKLTIQTKNGSG